MILSVGTGSGDDEIVPLADAELVVDSFIDVWPGDDGVVEVFDVGSGDDRAIGSKDSQTGICSVIEICKDGENVVGFAVSVRMNGSVANI